MAKYDSLRENLARRTSGEVTMTFRDIEQFVGDLPASSQTDQWWRATDSVQAQAWRTVGWRVSSVSQTREIVVFARNGTAADLAEAASELGRAFRYLSRHAFFSLGVLHPVNQVIAVISSILQQLRDYAATDKIEFTIRLSRMWPYRRVRLTFSNDILTLTLPGLPPFIRDQVKLSTKLDPKFKLSRMLPVLALGLFIGRLLAGLVQTTLQLPYRAFLAAVRCWSGGLRASLGSAAALFALFFVVFTTGDAWRFFGLESTPRFLALVIILIGLALAAMITAVKRAQDGWRTIAIKIAEDRAALQRVVRKRPVKKFSAARVALIEAPASVPNASLPVRLNIYVLFWFTLLSNLFSVAAVVAFVFIIIGLVAINPNAADDLIGSHFTTYIHFSLLGQPILLTRPLLVLSTMLGCIAALTLAVGLQDRDHLNDFLDSALTYHRRSLFTFVYYQQMVAIFKEMTSWPEITAQLDPRAKNAGSRLVQEILLHSDTAAIAGFLKLVRRQGLSSMRGTCLDLLTALPDSMLGSLSAWDVKFILKLAESDPGRAAQAESVRKRFQAATKAPGVSPDDGTLPPVTPAPVAPPAEAGAGTDENRPTQAGAARLAGPVVRRGMFGVQGTPDTSGYGTLDVRKAPLLDSPRPYGSYFDEVADALGLSDAIEHVVVDRGEITFYVRRERLPEVAAKLRDDPALRFELCSGVSGVHYPEDTGRELHAVYHMLSITRNRRVRLEVSVPDADPHVPSLVSVYPTCNWHERETWDFFGIIFDGHPALTRIEMPDDWKGHPQRKDYPLGGIPVEYRGAKIPPPEERRHYS